MTFQSTDLGLIKNVDRQTRATHFLKTAAKRPHALRQRAILEAHPEIKQLFGHDRRTFFITLGIVVMQTAIAGFFGHLGLATWWLALLGAYGFGAFANHALFVVIHDAGHNTIFERIVFNKWAAILADLPNVFSTAIGFRCYHTKHHSHLGDYDYDADLPSHWEARIFGHSLLGKAAWMFLFPALQLTRLGRLRGSVPMWGRWTYINFACILAYDIAIFYFFGANALLYLFASFWFSVGGLHPLAARWVQEHFTFDPAQETFDYYGPLNRIQLNIGYHNEHHDFPEVPWTRLPQLKKMAPEFYDDLKFHRSWFELFFKFIFDPRFTLYSRVDRSAANSAAKI
jgi:sphingolipid delta-4 desaturase